MKSWRSVEIIKGEGAERFRRYLKRNYSRRYYPSECFNYIHFEVFCDKAELIKLNDFLYKLAKGEEMYENIETGEVYTESEIRNLYEELKAGWSKTEKEIYSDFNYWLQSALDRNGSLRRI